MKQFFLIVAALAAFLFSSCTQDPSITVSPDVFNFTYEGGTQTAILTSNGEWSATPNNPAVTISPASGAGDSPISIILTKNTTTAELTYSVNFTCTVDGQSLSFPVSIKQGTDVPHIDIDPKSGSLDYKGGELTTSVTSNFAWTATTECTELTITPTSAEAGTTSVKIVVPESAGDQELSHVITFTCEGAKQDFTITQTVAAAPEIVIEPKVMDFEYEASQSEVTVTSNYSWTATADEGVTLSATSGESGDKVTISVTENKSNDLRELKAVFVCEKNGNKAEETLTIKQTGPEFLTYGGVDYKIKYLADGKLWMCQNLRYIPEGKSASDDLSAIDNGIWYPVKVEEDKTTLSLDKSEDGIAEKGYLYTMESALGVASGTLNADNCDDYEGAQGICPEGYHIPTIADIMELVGKSAGKTDEENPNAPYYYKDGGTSTFDLLEEDGFPVNVAGMITVANTSTAKGIIAGAIGSAGAKYLNTGYFIGSSFYKIFLNSDQSVKNIQYYALMPNVKNETLNGAFMGYKFGGSIRCVRDSE